MTPATESVFKAAFSLSADDRAALAELLLAGLDAEAQATIDVHWMAEVRRRLEAYDRGMLKTIPGAEVMRSLLSGTITDMEAAIFVKIPFPGEVRNDFTVAADGPMRPCLTSPEESPDD